MCSYLEAEGSCILDLSVQQRLHVFVKQTGLAAYATDQLSRPPIVDLSCAPQKCHVAALAHRDIYV